MHSVRHFCRNHKLVWVKFLGAYSGNVFWQRFKKISYDHDYIIFVVVRNFIRDPILQLYNECQHTILYPIIL